MENIKETLKTIQELMDSLIEDMEPSTDDFHERLRRPKPKIEAIKMEVKPEEDMNHEMDPMDPEEDKAEGEVESSPEEELKSRLLKLRGK